MEQRTILFRGKRVDNGEWIEGTGLTDFLNMYPDEKRHWLWADYRWCEVDTETIGQFTGQEDKNGKKIFSGHTIKNKTGRICEVRWSRFTGRWELLPENKAGTSEDLFYESWHKWEITGTIHDK